MKILHVIYDDLENPWLGGGGAVRANEINRRLAKTHDIQVLTGNYPNAENVNREGVQYTRVGSTHSYPISRLTFTANLPMAIRNSDCDLLVNDFSLFAPCFATSDHQRPVVHMLHHILGRHALKKYPVVGVLPWLFERIGFSQARQAITVSPSVQSALTPMLHPACTTWCVPNGVDQSLFDASPADNGYLAFLGRLDIYMKGLDNLLDAMVLLQRTHNVKLKIAGWGPERNRLLLENKIEELDLGTTVTLVGSVDDTEKCTLLSDATLVCVPSRFEGWGIVAIEAAAAGKAVVGTDIPGLRDAIVDGETGLLAPADDPAAFAGMVAQLLDDPDRRNQLAEAGRQRARQYQWEQIAAQQEQIYETVLTESQAL